MGRTLAAFHLDRLVDAGLLICGMNLELLRALVSGLPDLALEARFDARPPACCVTVVQAGAARGRD
jgi:hypothetical protein